jgi:transposase
MVLNGLGVMNQPLSWVPMFLHTKPTSRLLAPGIEAQHLNEDTLGRALETLCAYGVTALSSLRATTAAQRLGLPPTSAHLDRPSCHVDGHDNRAGAPDTLVIDMTRGSSRDPRPDLQQVLLDLLVEHHASIPLLMPPLSGNTSAAIDFRHVGTEPSAPLQTTHGLPGGR